MEICRSLLHLRKVLVLIVLYFYPNNFIPKFTAAENVGDKFEIFEKWLLDNGAKFPKLELKVCDKYCCIWSLTLAQDYGDEVRGCHATTDIVEDEVIIEIPLQCLITVEMGKDTDVRMSIFVLCSPSQHLISTQVGRAIIASNLDLDAPKHIFLMLFMLIDRKKPDSFFKV